VDPAAVTVRGGTADSGKVGLRLGGSVTHAGKTAMVPLLGGDEPSSGNVAVDVGNRRLGASKFSLEAGEDAFVEVNLSKKERKILRKASSVEVTVYSGGSSSTQTLRVTK
jgi:ABC-type molybdenum transport system ATPase subunit/photorepair protein PhrA